MEVVGPKRNPLEHLSFSRLNTYNGCSEAFRLRYIERVAGQPQGPLIAGSAVHEALEAMERDGLWRDDEGIGKVQQGFLDAFDAGLSEASDSPYPLRWGGRKTRDFPEGEDERWWRFMGPLFVKRACHLRRADDRAGYVVRDQIEANVRTTLPGTGHIVTGYVDAFLLVTPDGEPVIRDWKTGKVGGNDPLQLATYAWILRTAEISAPDLGQYVYLRAANPEKAVKTFDLRPYLDLIEPLYSGLVKGVEAGVFAMKPSTFCTACAVKASCAYGRTLD